MEDRISSEDDTYVGCWTRKWAVRVHKLCIPPSADLVCKCFAPYFMSVRQTFGIREKNAQHIP